MFIVFLEEVADYWIIEFYNGMLTLYIRAWGKVNSVHIQCGWLANKNKLNCFCVGFIGLMLGH
jgi:hypothetical protein